MFYQLSTLQNIQIASLAAHCSELSRKRLSKVTLADLALLPHSFGGVYLFYSKKACLYIGKCSRRAFVDRIPAHFDLRESAWMNSFPKKLVKFRICPNLDDAVFYALTCDMCAFTFSSNQAAWENADSAERLFRAVLQPLFNSCRNNFNGAMTVGACLNQV